MAAARVNRLTKLRIDEVSSVDRGAGEGVKVVLMKRDAQPDHGEAVAALAETLEKIATETPEAEREAAVAAAVAKFRQDIGQQAAEQETEMEKTVEALQKKLDDAQKAQEKATELLEAATKRIAALELESGINALAEPVRAYAKALKTDEDKKKFLGKKPDEQEAECAEAKKRAINALDPAIQKRLDDAAEESKVLKILMDEREASAFAKRATECGLTEKQGDILRKAYGGDAAAQGELEKLVKGLTEQVKKGKLFDTIGKDGDGKGATAGDEMKAKAAELRKADPKLTPEQAYTKAYEDPANVEIAKRVREEELRR